MHILYRLSANFVKKNPFNIYVTSRGYKERVWLEWKQIPKLDFVVARDKAVKSMWLIKEAMKRYPGGNCFPAKAFIGTPKDMGITVSSHKEFMNKFPSVFEWVETPPNSNCRWWYRLTDNVLDLDRIEQDIYETDEKDSVDRLCKLLMMTEGKMLPLEVIDPFKWDLGLHPHYLRKVVPKYPEHLRIVDMDTGPFLQLVRWRDELAISTLQVKAAEKCTADGRISLRRFVQEMPITFWMSYEGDHHLLPGVQEWYHDWQSIPYVSPYDDVSKLDPINAIMEKWKVGVFHELLSLTIHKRIDKVHIVPLLPYIRFGERRFKSFVYGYPGIFYYTGKSGVTTLTLKECYKRRHLLDPHPLGMLREEYFQLMKEDMRSPPRILEQATRHDRRASDDEEDFDDDTGSVAAHGDDSDFVVTDGDDDSSSDDGGGFVVADGDDDSKSGEGTDSKQPIRKIITLPPKKGRWVLVKTKRKTRVRVFKKYK